jgi:hypothetical protein
MTVVGDGVMARYAARMLVIVVVYAVVAGNAALGFRSGVERHMSDGGAILFFLL